MFNSMENIFGEDGLLSKHISGFSSRPQQQEMAESIQETLDNNSVLIAEAGTGTGKTFAYLAPVILSGKKVFISTGTKNLQDQLFSRDLPTLRKALAQPFTAALLKGRSNYLCHHRLKLSIGDPQQRYQQATLHDLTVWSQQTKSGDLSETDLLDEKSPLWPKVTSTVDNCLGQECPDYNDCFIVEARRQAQEADVVVINHHLLMSDMALKTTGQGEILPAADAYIVDEAHQLPAIASQFLGNRISSHQIQELCRDSIGEMEQDAADMDEIRDIAAKVEAALHALRLVLGGDEQRVPWKGMFEKPGVATKLETLEETLDDLVEILALAAQRGKGLEKCAERAEELQQNITTFSHFETEQALILWIDIRGSGFILHATPFEVSSHFQKWMEEKPAAWVFTSATLTVAGKFNNFCHQLGIEDAETEVWESPFNFAEQSLLYMPHIPVEPNHQDYTGHIVELAKTVIDYSKGRTFLLFTSYRALNHVAEALADSEYPLMVQGSAAKSTLLENFRDHGNAVLLGTNSFWEGVDVRGEALSCVIIDKIPFASPGDPVLQARIDSLRERGGNPFSAIQIPAAVIQLKQGIGRLIRDSQDYGVLVLCDPRFLTKPYGKLFLRSLPPMPITQDVDAISEFFSKKEKTA